MAARMCIVRLTRLGHNEFAAGSREFCSRAGVYYGASRNIGSGTPVVNLRGVNVKRGLVVLFALLMSAFVISRPLFAHHSSAAFDLEHQISLKGTVSNFEWTNPHIFIYLEVKSEDGGVEPWRVEANSPNMLSRAGWKKEMINLGDAIVVSGSPAKNKSKVLRLVSITLASGQKFDGQGFK